VVEVLAKPFSDDSAAFAKRIKRRIELAEEIYGYGHPDWIPGATPEEQSLLKFHRANSEVGNTPPLPALRRLPMARQVLVG